MSWGGAAFGDSPLLPGAPTPLAFGTQDDVGSSLLAQRPRHVVRDIVRQVPARPILSLRGTRVRVPHRVLHATQSGAGVEGAAASPRAARHVRLCWAFGGLVLCPAVRGAVAACGQRVVPSVGQFPHHREQGRLDRSRQHPPQ